MIYIQIRRKSSTTNAALRNHIHRSIIEFHKRNRTRRFSVVGYGSSAISEFTKIPRSSATNFRLHDHFTQFVGNSFDIIRNMNIETRNRQTSFRSHVCPNWRRKTDPTFANHLFKSRLQFRFI